jgi:hypothetical protein
LILLSLILLIVKRDFIIILIIVRIPCFIVLCIVDLVADPISQGGLALSAFGRRVVDPARSGLVVRRVLFSFSLSLRRLGL